MRRVLFKRAILLCLCFTSPLFAAEDTDFFRTQVAPLFERRCVSCHNDDDKKGGLSLEGAVQFQRGGVSGPVVVPRKPNDSSLLTYVEGEKPEMPKNGPPPHPRRNCFASHMDRERGRLASGGET